VTGDSFIKSLYWTIQTMTTVGYGTSFSDWGGVEQALCITWMLISVGYWGCLLLTWLTSSEGEVWRIYPSNKRLQFYLPKSR